MRKIDQIRPDGNNVPIHVQAAKAGADIGALRAAGLVGANYRRSTAAKKISEAWDYRAGGLTVDDARGYLAEWQRTIQSGRHLRTGGRPTPRILHMQHFANDLRSLYRDRVQGLDHMIAKTRLYGESTRLTWGHTQCKIVTPGGRIIIVTRVEDVEWDRDRRGRGKHWPTKKSVYYRSRLLRADWRTPPGIRELIRIGHEIDYLPIEAATERRVTHDARGNWGRRVVAALLGESAAEAWESARAEFFAAEVEAHAENAAIPRTAYKIVEQNGCLRSVYDPKTIYILGEWIEDEAREDHGGGLYCYLTPGHAVEAARMGDVFAAAWTAGKTLVLCKCEAAGNRIAYGRKYAFDRLRIVEVLQPITNTPEEEIND
jgi:hypothetical protein